MTRLGAGWMALGVGAVLALCVGGPDLPRLCGALLGYKNPDSDGAVYLHQAFHAAIAAGRWPGTDPNTLVPVGTPLFALHGGNVLEMVLSGLFAIFLPFPLWYNAAALCWIPLNLLAFLPLGRHLWGRWDAAVAVGAAWAIFPPSMGELASGRLTQIVDLGLPLATLGLLRLSERPRPGDRWLAGGGIALAGLGYWFFGIFLVILSPVFFAHGWGRRPRRILVLDFVAALGIAALLALPFTLPVLLPRLTGAWSPAPPLDAATASPVFDNALKLMGAQPVQLQHWLPWVWVLGIGATLAWGQRQGLWLALAGACVLFALGPGQDIAGTAHVLPYALLWRHVPFLDRLTHPGRWLLLGGLFLVLLAADGLARRVPWLLVLLPLGGLAQLWALGNLPLGTWTLDVPPIWQAVADRPGGAVIVVPVLHSPLSCRFQGFAHRPLLGGMVEDKPWAWPPRYRAFIEQSPLLMDLYALGRGTDREIEVYTTDLARLHGAGFDTVVLEQESWARLPANVDVPVKQRLVEAFGASWSDDASGTAWKLPTRGTDGTPPVPELHLPEP